MSPSKVFFFQLRSGSAEGRHALLTCGLRCILRRVTSSLKLHAGEAMKSSVSLLPNNEKKKERKKLSNPPNNPCNGYSHLQSASEPPSAVISGRNCVIIHLGPPTSLLVGVESIEQTDELWIIHPHASRPDDMGYTRL